MIKILMGPKGTGKTKAFLDMVNNAVDVEMGNVVCVTLNNRHVFDLKSSVRLINTTEYRLKTYDNLYGFICGIISGNYDITHIFIDSLTKIVPIDFEQMDVLLKHLEELSSEFNVKFTLTVSAPLDDATENMKGYLAEH